MAWTNQSKNSASYSNQSKNSASWGNQSKGGNDFLLIENGSYLLLEIGNKIILEQSVAGAISWTNQNKN